MCPPLNASCTFIIYQWNYTYNSFYLIILIPNNKYGITRLKCQFISSMTKSACLILWCCFRCLRLLDLKWHSVARHLYKCPVICSLEWADSRLGSVYVLRHSDHWHTNVLTPMGPKASIGWHLFLWWVSREWVAKSRSQPEISQAMVFSLWWLSKCAVNRLTSLYSLSQSEHLNVFVSVKHWST